MLSTLLHPMLTTTMLRADLARLRTLLTTHPEIDPDTVQVNFTDFGASSLDIVVTCFSVTTVLGEHLNVREDVCLQIMDIIEGLGLRFAYPSRTVYLHHADGDNPERTSRCAVS